MKCSGGAESIDRFLETTPRPERLCRGTLLSRQQYLVDVQDWGFRDARLEERVQMNAKNIAVWTDAIGK